MRRERACALVAFALASCPFPARAHLYSTGMGPLYDGALHFLGSPGDLLSALALALLAGMRGAGCGRSAMFVLPAAWLGAALVGSTLHAVESSTVASALWLLLLGGLLAADAKLSARGVAVLAAGAGAYHGFLNGSGLGASLASAAALFGLAAAVFALVALASALPVAIRAGWARIGLRVIGSWIAASGLLWLGWALRAGAG
jgi:hydrogenase/urease accessory protein HupE